MTKKDYDRFIEIRNELLKKRRKYEDEKNELEKLMSDEKVKRYIELTYSVSKNEARELESAIDINVKALRNACATPSDVYIYLGVFTNTGSTMYETIRSSNDAEIVKYISIDNVSDVLYIDLCDEEKFKEEHRVIMGYNVYKNMPMMYYNRLRDEYIELLLKYEPDVALEKFYEKFS